MQPKQHGYPSQSRWSTHLTESLSA